MSSLHNLNRIAVFFILGALALGVPGGGAQAAKEISRTPFTKFASNGCPSSGGCDVSFGAVPNKRRFEIRTVSCYVSIGNVNGRVLYWYLQAAKNSEVLGRIHLRPQHLGTTSTAVTYNANEQAYLVLPAGTTMSVGMTRDSSTAGGITHFDCTISGDKVRLK